MVRSRFRQLHAFWTDFRRQSSRSALGQALANAACVLVLFGVAAGGAFWFGEALLPPHAGSDAGAFWLQGQSAWAPDYGRCRQCGSVLTPRIDELSACRHCEVCNVSYRRHSLPPTLEEQERVWK